MKKILCLFILISQAVHSGFDNGNGGDVVVCDNGVPFKVKLLDFYEGHLFNSRFEIDLGHSNLSIPEKVNIVLNRIHKISNVRSKNYEAQYKEFADNIFWVRNTDLVDIPDSAHIGLPRGCRIEQIAIQLSDRSIPNKRYVINEDLWDMLDNDQKVGLIFHEIIYTEALKHGHKNSFEVRKLNSWILSKKFRQASKHDFDNRMREINFPVYEQNEYFPNLLFDRLYANGNLEIIGVISHPSRFRYANQDIKLLKGAEVAFFSNDISKVKSVKLRGDYLKNGRYVIKNFYSKNSILEIEKIGIPIDSLQGNRFDKGFNLRFCYNWKQTKNEFCNTTITGRKANSRFIIPIKVGSYLFNGEIGHAYGLVYNEYGNIFELSLGLNRLTKINIGQHEIFTRHTIFFQKEELVVFRAFEKSKVFDINGSTFVVPENQCWRIKLDRFGKLVSKSQLESPSQCLDQPIFSDRFFEK